MDHQGDLTNIERAFLINAFEIDILPGVMGDLSSSEQDMQLSELATVLMSLVDRGLVEVHHLVARDEGLAPGDAIAKQDLPHLLADPLSWEYPPDSWVGSLTLVETEAGGKLMRTAPEQPS